MTVVAGGFAFVCWGLWALANKGSRGTPLLTLFVVAAVAAGIFGLARLVGHLVFEQRLGRPRHSARVAHAMTAAFLFCAGAAYLKQTDWVMDILTTVDNYLNGNSTGR